MDILQDLGVGLGLASLAGINLYLTVFVAGLAIRYDWLSLAAAHESLAVLGNPWIVGIAGGLYVVEFFADKIPWLDSAWDVGQTFVRPIGGAFLGLGALGELSPEVSVIAALLAGGAALSTHSLKASGRMLINLSPEPVSNSVASVGEDGLVLGGLGLVALAPVAAFFVFAGLCVLSVVLVAKLWGRVGQARRERRERLKGPAGA